MLLKLNMEYLQLLGVLRERYSYELYLCTPQRHVMGAEDHITDF
jgi:hypothetical protein